MDNLPSFLQPDDKFQELQIAYDALDKPPDRTSHTCR